AGARVGTADAFDPAFGDPVGGATANPVRPVLIRMRMLSKMVSGPVVVGASVLSRTTLRSMRVRIAAGPIAAVHSRRGELRRNTTATVRAAMPPITTKTYSRTPSSSSRV